MTRLSWMAAGVLGLALVASPALAQNPCKVNTDKVFFQLRNPTKDLTMLAAHRGVHALYHESQYRSTPENSLQSIENAANECIEMIELDVRLTEDGVPIITHDETWGRETNVGYKYTTSKMYNPWSNDGPNPLVSTWKLADVKRDLILRTTEDMAWSTWNESPPTLREAIQFMKQRGIASVLALDLKDNTALLAAWQVVAQENFWNHTVLKVDVLNMPNRAAFESYFYGKKYVDGVHSDLLYASIIPVYNTGNIAPNNTLGTGSGESKVLDSANSFNTNNVYFSALEFNIKQTNGILTATSNKTWRASRAIFNPRREWDGGNGQPEYFRKNGQCCSPLSDYWFKGGEYGLPSDTDDRRGDWAFVLDENKFDLITTDNVLQIRTELQKRNRRNVSLIRD